MPLQTDQLAPDFEQDTTNGSIRLHAWLGASWGLLFSQRWAMRSEAAAELAELSRLKPCLDVLGVKVVGLCLATSDAHADWLTTEAGPACATPHFPMVTDADLRVSALYGVISPRGSATPLLARGFLIAPDRRVRTIYTPQSCAAFDWAGIVANLRQDMAPTCVLA